MIRRSLWLTCGLAAALSAQALRITGLADGQVIQRDADNRGSVTVSGAEGALTARVTGPNGRPVPGKVHVSAGRLQGLPAGGPYVITLKDGQGGSATIRDVFVGDLWVLAGQSNMEGVGNLENVEPPHPRVRSFNMKQRWVPATEPLHQRPDAEYSAYWARKDNKPTKLEGAELERWVQSRKKGAGLGLPFAVAMVKRTGVPVGLIPAAYGGTRMDQWSPALKAEGTASLYGAMIQRIQDAGGRVRGVLWYQGESDASPQLAGRYAEKFEAMIAALRRDSGQADLPFYFVQLGRYVNSSNQNEWNQVQEAQRLLEGKVARTGLVAAVDTSLDDAIHVGTPDLKRLGVRLAHLACKDLGVASCQGYQRGPRLAGATLEGTTLVRVKFNSVNGKLTSEGRLNGFSIAGPDGAELPVIYRQQINPVDGSEVLLSVQGTVPDGAVLQYGRGKNPYANLRDGLDMAAPVFGPVALQRSNSSN